MKIAIVGENYYPTVGGIQEAIYHQAKFLLSAGHEVCVITGMPTVPQWLGPKDEEWVVRVGKSVRYGVMGSYTNFTFGPRVAGRLRKLFRERRFDLLNVHGPCDFGLPMLAYAFFSGPKVATLHSPIVHSFSRTLLSPYFQFVMRRMEAVIAVSENAAARLRRYADFDYEVIPNGVDIAAFSKGKKMARFDDGFKNVVYMGRLEHRNGLDILISALPMVVKAHPMVRLIIAGDGPQGTAEYERLVPQDLKDRVNFIGAVFEERPDLYTTADVFVLPVRGGCCPIMVLEALAAGTPIVSTPFLEEEYRGSNWGSVKITADFNPESLAKSINEVLAEDPRRRIEMGNKIIKEYDWSVIGKRIYSVYERLLPNRSPN